MIRDKYLINLKINSLMYKLSSYIKYTLIAFLPYLMKPIDISYDTQIKHIEALQNIFRTGENSSGHFSFLIINKLQVYLIYQTKIDLFCRKLIFLMDRNI